MLDTTNPHMVVMATSCIDVLPNLRLYVRAILDVAGFQLAPDVKVSYVPMLTTDNDGIPGKLGISLVVSSPVTGVIRGIWSDKGNALCFTLDCPELLPVETVERNLRVIELP